MKLSLKEKERVSHIELEERLETVKILSSSDTESYEVMKDSFTGEHYLMYHYTHLNVAEGGHKETYFHFMPIEHDAVIAIVLGEEPFDYPQHWKHPFLRNSSDDDSYVWFDPGYADSYEHYEAIGKQISDKLLRFKQEGKLDPESVRKLMDELDRL
ncbi:hypothetical protein [Paenibacillus senegalensis]|uniref:hypothetical protein n=1 Tax=Paenibacillus senegalensis TaxID=1465766 RepID=UPI0002880975|nr:hypothetical protein [Paenibacillus senegalensis]